MIKSNRFWIGVNYSFILLVMTGMATVVSIAMVFQYVYGELPCPLCLLQRMAFLAICFGGMMSFRDKYSFRYIGFSILFTTFALMVSIRQSLLDIIPRAGHHWVGSPIFGLHMPVWSIILSLTLLVIFALKIAFISPDYLVKFAQIEKYPFLDNYATVITWYIILLCAVNFISVFLQCGLHACHTEFYRLIPQIHHS